MKPVLLLFLLCFGSTAFGQKTLSWSSATALNSHYSSEGYDIAVDKAANYYVVGHFMDVLDIGPFHLASNGDMDVFVAKFNAAHTPIWAKSFGGPDSEFGDAIAVDTDGNVGITGIYAGQMPVGTDTLNSLGKRDIYLIKMSPGGQVLWSRSIGGSENEDVPAGSLATYGNTFLISGIFGKVSNPLPVITTCMVDTFVLTSQGNGDVFLARFDAQGRAMWANSAGSDLWDKGETDNRAVDHAGNCYIFGEFAGASMHFGAYELLATGAGEQLFVAKYDSLGTFLWARCAGAQTGGGRVYTASLAADSAGTVFLAGSYGEHPLYFENTALEPFGSGADEDAFLASYASDGQFQWAKRGGGESYDLINSVAVDNTGNVYTAGYFCAQGWFDGDTLNSDQRETAFLACYAKSSDLRWVSDCGTTHRFHAVSAAEGRRLCLTGYFTGQPSSFGSISIYNNGFYNCFAATTDMDSPPKPVGSLVCYPNPASDQLNVRFPPSANGTALELLDAAGRTITHLMLALGQQEATLDVGSLASGVYVVVLAPAQGERQTKQIVIAK